MSYELKIISAIVGLILSLFVMLICFNYESPENASLKYSAWIKVYGVTNLTFKEWNALRDSDLLPGQNGISKTESALIGFTAGAAAGAISSGRK